MKTRSRGPLVAQTSVGRLAQTCGAGLTPELKSPANVAVQRRSSPGVVAPDSACHAGGRGFESRRSRKNPCKSPSCVVGLDARSRPTTQLSLKATRKRSKSGRQHPFQADRGRVQARHEDRVPLHETTGVQGGGKEAGCPLALEIGQPLAEVVAPAFGKHVELVASPLCRRGRGRRDARPRLP
jgi:hypothetical protein